MKHMGLLIAAIFLSLSIFGCGDDEEKKVDIITETLGQPVDQDQDAQVEEIQDDELEALDEAVIPEEEPTALSDDEYIPRIYDSGPYVLQVGVSPSKAVAEKLAKKIENKGFNAYITTVENPADLVGTYYRVRVGYFKKLTQARLFGHNILMPMNIAFWIDNRANDEISNPASDEEDDAEDLDEAGDAGDEVVEIVEEVAPAPAKEEPKTEEKAAAPAVAEKKAAPAAKPAKKDGKPDDWASDDDDWSKDDDWGK